VTSASADLNPSGADISMRAELVFPGEVTAVVSASMVEGVTLRSDLVVVGDIGTLTVDNMVFPSAGHSIRVDIGGVPYVTTVAGRTTYDHQLEAVLDGLRGGTPLPTEGEDPIGNMAVIDAIYEAAGFDRSAWA
jgi:predicted dehydrogenase